MATNYMPASVWNTSSALGGGNLPNISSTYNTGNTGVVSPTSSDWNKPVSSIAAKPQTTTNTNTNTTPKPKPTVMPSSDDGGQGLNYSSSKNPANNTGINALNNATNFANTLSQNMAAYYNKLLAPSTSALSGLLSNEPTALEQAMLSKAQEDARNSLAASYQGMPGHSSYAGELAKAYNDAATGLAYQRQSQIPGIASQIASTLNTAGQQPFNNLYQLANLGQQGSQNIIPSLASIFQNAINYNTGTIAPRGGK